MPAAPRTLVLAHADALAALSCGEWPVRAIGIVSGPRLLLVPVERGVSVALDLALALPPGCGRVPDGVALDVHGVVECDASACATVRAFIMRRLPSPASAVRLASAAACARRRIAVPEGAPGNNGTL